MPLETVVIKVEPCEGNEKGEVVINKSDFVEGMITVADYNARVEKARQDEADEAARKAQEAAKSATPSSPKGDETKEAPKVTEEAKATEAAKSDAKADGKGPKGK